VASIKLASATQDTRAIIGTASRMLKEIFKAGYNYQKCGVQLSHIQPQSSPGQLELFDFADSSLPTENRLLMKAVDRINRRFPKAISVAATGFDKTWKAKAERVSQRYTTDWLELVKVR
jgi:DNA polymerase V